MFRQRLEECYRRKSAAGVISKSVLAQLLFLSLTFCGSAEAALFHVPEIANPKTPAQQLIDAINAANAAGEPSVVEIEAGTYTYIQPADHVEGDNALPAITGDVTLRGLGSSADQTIIQRDDAIAGVPKFRIMHVTPHGKLTLERLTLRGGSTTCDARCISNDHPMDTGGAVYVLATREIENGPEIRGQLFVRNSILRDNISENCGGAIRNDGGHVEVEDSLITNNRQPYGRDGAGIYNDAHYKQHRATAIMPEIVGQVIVRRSTFVGNVTGGEGGGLYNEKGNADVYDSSFVGNYALRGGGGIGNGVGTLNVNNTTIYGNYTQGQGGGVVASWSSEEISDPNLSVTRLTNVTVSGNVAEGLDGFTGELVMGGGGLAVKWGHVEMRNSVIQQNVDPNGRECFTGVDLYYYGGTKPIKSLGNNILGNFSVCADPSYMETTSQDMAADVPGLASCRTLGGNGREHLPIMSVNSAVYNAGNAVGCSAADQLGHARSGHCSIGAVEYYDLQAAGEGQACPRALASDGTRIINYHVGSGGSFETIFKDPPPGSSGGSITPPAQPPATSSPEKNQPGVKDATGVSDGGAGGGGADFWLPASLLLWYVARRRR